MNRIDDSFYLNDSELISSFDYSKSFRFVVGVMHRASWKSILDTKLRKSFSESIFRTLGWRHNLEWNKTVDLPKFVKRLLREST